MQKVAVINDIRGATTLSVLGGVLVPIALVFVLFSTPRSRRQPIFWIQCLALALAMSEAAIEVASYHIDIETNGLHPQLFFNLCAARESLKWIIPWVTDCALVFKVLYFYPRTLYSRKKQASMVGFPALIKIPRLVVIIINLVIMCKAFARQETTWPSGLKYQVAEIAMQVADNSYTSSILLYKSWTFFHSSSIHVSRTARAQRRARHIVESVAMSFLPALGIQIAFLVVQAIPGDNAYELLEAQNYLFIFNVYISLIFSILATSWSSICNVAEWNREGSARIGQRSLQLSGGSSKEKRNGGSGGGTAGAMEKELPEHRTLLQYLTTSDEVEELTSVSEDSNSFSTSGSSGKGNNLRRDPMELEKGHMESKESLHSNNANITIASHPYTSSRHKVSRPSVPSQDTNIPGYGGVVVSQERERATSPSSESPTKAVTTMHAKLRSATLPYLERDAMTQQTRVAPFKSPQLPPFRFQDGVSNSNSNASSREEVTYANAL